MSADEDQETTSPLTSILRFIVGAWLNLRYTRLISSLILAVLPIVVYYSFNDFFGDWTAGFDPVAGFNRLTADLNLVGMLTGIALLVFYPLAREIYFRTTRPLAEALTGLSVIGFLLVFLVFIIRIWLFMVVWVFSVPLGIVGFFYLAITEASGRGYRLI